MNEKPIQKPWEKVMGNAVEQICQILIRLKYFLNPYMTGLSFSVLMWSTGNDVCSGGGGKIASTGVK